MGRTTDYRCFAAALRHASQDRICQYREPSRQNALLGWTSGGRSSNVSVPTCTTLFGAVEAQTTTMCLCSGSSILCRVYDENETVTGSPYRFQRIAHPDGSLETPEQLVERLTALFHEAAKNYLGYTEEIAKTIPFERKRFPRQRSLSWWNRSRFIANS